MPKRSKSIVVSVAATVAVSLVVVTIVYMSSLPDRDLDSAIDSAQIALTQAASLADDAQQTTYQAIGAAIVQAKSAVEQTLRPLIEAPDDMLRDAFLSYVDRSQWQRAESVLELFQPTDDDYEGKTATILLDIGVGRFGQARESAWDCAERFTNQRSHFIQLWYQSFAADPEFLPPQPIRIEPGGDITSIRTLDWASSVLLRFYSGRDTVAVLKPEQTNPFSNYRGEIAAYRLCPLIHCDISIPRNIEVRITEEDLAELMGFDDVESVGGVRRHNYALTLFEDANGQRWIYGTLKDWVPGFTQFPIEEIEGWRHLTTISQSAESLRRMSFEEAIPDLALADPEWFQGFINRAERTSVDEFIHQMSDMHVLDVLINNWDRYSSSYPSSNCQWDHGQFVSIDNGASFHDPDEWRGHEVELRIRRIQLFSRSTVNAIRWMEPDALYPILFPENPYTDEIDEGRWQFFLERRQWLLDYIDDLIERYGEDEVLVFP